jgi:iron(III) transport system substrate-binding protein
MLLSMLLGVALVAMGCTSQPPPVSAPSADRADPEWQKVVDAARQEGRVLVYGTGFLRGVEGAMIAQEFQRIYGISVDVVDGAGSPSFERLRQETKAGVPTADVFLASPPWPTVVEKEGFLQSLQDKRLPVLKEPKSVWKVDPASMSDAYLIQAPIYPNGHLVINTRLLQSADYPKSFHELASDARYIGKIAWVDPKTTGDVAFKWTIWGYIANGLSLEDVWAIYANQKPALYADPPAEAEAVSRGEAAIAMGLSTFESAAEAGAPLKVLRFASIPVVTNVSAFGLVKQAQHPNAALVLMNWAISREGQEFITQTRRAMSLRTDVPDRLPDVLQKAELVGGADKGPAYVLAPVHAVFSADLHSKVEVWRRLPTGLPQAEFETAITTFVKEWEAANGGPMRQAIPFVER